MSGAEYEKDPCVACAAAAEVAAVGAALPAVPGRNHRFCVLRRSDVSDPQRIALAFLRRSLRRALCNARERTLLRGGRHCLSLSGIPFQRQRRVALQKADGEQLVFCIEKNKQLSVGQAYRVYLPLSAIPSEVKTAHLPQPCALAVEKIEPASFDCVESAD